MVTGEFKENKENKSIEFNLIIQFPDNNDNQDSEKGKTFNGKVVVNYETSFANDSWEEIAATVKENPSAYAVGSTKKIKVYDNPNGETTNGTYKEYTVRVANNTTPEECTTNKDFSQTACGFVVEFVDIVEKRRMNPSGEHNGTNYPVGWNVGGWPDSEMSTYANGAFFNNLPEDLRNVIIDTKVISGHGSSDKNANRLDGNWESKDKIYLLSVHEVYEDGTSDQVSTYDTAWKNTRQLDYYANLKVTTSNYSGAIKKNINGNASNWWLRATLSLFNNIFLRVTDYGRWYHRTAYDSSGFAPAFRIG